MWPCVASHRTCTSVVRRASGHNRRMDGERTSSYGDLTPDRVTAARWAQQWEVCSGLARRSIRKTKHCTRPSCATGPKAPSLPHPTCGRGVHATMRSHSSDKKGDDLQSAEL